MTDPTGAILGKVGVGILRAVAPSTLAWLKVRTMGKTVLFVGPSRAGKTSYINFLRTGSFADPTDSMQRTTSSKNTGTLQIKSPNGIVTIDLKSVIDTKGQDLPSEHAKLVSKFRPHALCIILDASSDFGSSIGDYDRNSRLWLEEFFEELCELRSSDTRVFTKLKSFVVLLNKIDMLEDVTVAERRANQVKLLAATQFRASSARLYKMINVKSLSLLEDHDQGRLATRATLTLFTPFVRD